MPKCNRCPIIAECRQSKKIQFMQVDGKGIESKIDICPLLYAVGAALKYMTELGKPPIKDSMIDGKRVMVGT